MPYETDPDLLERRRRLMVRRPTFTAPNDVASAGVATAAPSYQPRAMARRPNAFGGLADQLQNAQGLADLPPIRFAPISNGGAEQGMARASLEGSPQNQRVMNIARGQAGSFGIARAMGSEFDNNRAQTINDGLVDLAEGVDPRQRQIVAANRAMDTSPRGQQNAADQAWLTQARAGAMPQAQANAQLAAGGRGIQRAANAPRGVNAIRDQNFLDNNYRQGQQNDINRMNIARAEARPGETAAVKQRGIARGAANAMFNAARGAGRGPLAAGMYENATALALDANQDRDAQHRRNVELATAANPPRQYQQDTETPAMRQYRESQARLNDAKSDELHDPSGVFRGAKRFLGSLGFGRGTPGGINGTVSPSKTTGAKVKFNGADVDYSNVPSGATYITPDGVARRKK